MAKRKTIVQRAAVQKGYEKPRNVIIQYEAVQARVVRQFQRLGVTQENPQAYIARYGAQLIDAVTLLQQARAAGVVEDISPPAGAVASFQSSSAEFSSSGAIGGAEGLDIQGGAGAAGGAGGAGFSSSFDSSSYTANGGTAGLSGFESAQGGAAGGFGGAASSFESSSYASAGGIGLDAAGGYDTSGAGGISSSGYGAQSGFGTSSGAAGNIDFAAAAFQSADANKDGTLDANEFRQFVGSNINQ